ncbi:hypothetical protein [Spongiimicrobium sp. 2-473A-2-J]|uniref:hypothetical protein n=1 Tax=Eudoraea algarum TaxID=3417568 RepID=UPI003D3684DF
MVSSFKKYKEYLPLAIILPTLLGALVQLIHLIRISSGFYKFFSLSQSIIDGSYILLQLTIFCAAFYIMNHFANDDEFYVFKNQTFMQGNTGKKKKILFWRLLRINVGFAFSVFFIQNFAISFSTPSMKTIGLLLILALLSGVFLAWKRTKMYLQKLLWLHKAKATPVQNKAIQISSRFVFFVFTFFIFLAVVNSKPPTIGYNNSVFIERLIKEYNLEGARILYFNDSYIIVDVQNKDCEWQKGVFKTEEYILPNPFK